jgi:hypothetical protein
VQFHPEKNLGKFTENEGINHSWMAETVNRYFADKFVSLARQNKNSFGDYWATQQEIIENYDKLVRIPKYGMIYVFE